MTTPIDQNHAERHANRIVGNATTAEDMVQETLLRVIRRGADDLEGRDFQRYFYRALTNACINRLRRERLEGEALAAVVLPPDPAPGQIELLERKELIELVDAALHRLPWRERIAIVLRQWDDQSYKEIGLALEITETHAATLVYRGMKRIREQLRGLGSSSTSSEPQKPARTQPSNRRGSTR